LKGLPGAKPHNPVKPVEYSSEYQLPSSDGSHDENAGAVIVRGEEGRPSDGLGLEQRGESGEGKPKTTRSVMGLANR